MSQQPSPASGKAVAWLPEVASPSTQPPSNPSHHHSGGKIMPSLPGIRRLLALNHGRRQSCVAHKSVSRHRKRQRLHLGHGPDDRQALEELQMRKREMYEENRALIENHMDYGHIHNDCADVGLQERAAAVSQAQREKQLRRKPGKPGKPGPLKLRKFMLGKGFSPLDSGALIGSLRPLFHTIDIMDLSNQCIGKKGALQLASFLRLRECHVVALRMQRSQLTDESLSVICRSLQFNETITTIDLAHNSMAHSAFTALGEILPFNTALKELKLSWNNCHGAGLRGLCKGLTLNKAVKRLDLSWNLLGRAKLEAMDTGQPHHPHHDQHHHSNQDDHVERDGPDDAIAAFACLVRKNRSLRHLDLSNCSLSPRHARIFAGAFNNNHTITGLHYEGNAGVADGKGFIHVNEDKEAFQVSGQLIGIDPGLTAAALNQCWECRCWQETCFTFDQNSTSPLLQHTRPPSEIAQQMYVHLSIDHWKADIMALAADGSFITYRMLPPGRTWFFFSRGPYVYLSNTCPIALHPRLNLERNYIDVPREDSFTGYRLLRFRDTPCVDHPSNLDLARVRAEWDVNRSAFAYRVRVHGDVIDSAELIVRCVKQDFSYTKLLNMKVISLQERTELSEMLVPLYAAITRIYQMYAAQDSNLSPFQMTWQGFTQFCSDHHVLDARCTVEAIGQIFLVTNVELEENAENDASTLTRFEFLEMVVRIALFKYVGLRAGQAVERLFEECIKPYALDRALLNNDFFRYTCLYSQPVGRVMHDYEERLAKVYGDYCTTTPCVRLKGMEGHPRRQMSMDDYFLFLYDARIMRKELPGFTVVDARRLFLRSKLLTEDEQAMDLHTMLAFPDFLEALTRLICVPVVVARVVVELKLPEADSFHVLLQKSLDLIIDTIYFIDTSTNKPLRKLAPLRKLPAYEQDRIPFAYIRKILKRPF